VLRLFLETYHGKALPKKGIKHLNIWADWLATFSDAEQEFFKLLADAIWEKGENELLLDDVLKNENLKLFFTEDRINAPYPRLKNNGWISRYVKDLNACVAFTVEGALLFIFGKQLQNRSMDMSIELIDEIFEKGSKMQKAGLESFLCEEAMRGELGLITKLIDEGGDMLEICIRPLLHYIKAFGVEDTLSKLLEDTTENDWQALLNLNKMLDELQLQVLRKAFLSEVITRISFSNKYDTELGLIAIEDIDDEKARIYYSKIDGSAEIIKYDDKLLDGLGDCEKRFARYDNALDFYQRCLDIRLRTYGAKHPLTANSYSAIGRIFYSKGEYDKALEFCQKCLDIRLKSLGVDHPSVANSFNTIGIVWDSKGEYTMALEFYQKALVIRLKKMGGQHPYVATLNNNIGLAWQKKGEFEIALEFYQKCLGIYLLLYGDNHPQVAVSLNNIGGVLDNKGEYDKALELYQKSLEIEINYSGGDHPSVATSFNNIGGVWDSKGEYDKAFEFYQKSLDIRLKLHTEEHPDVANLYNNIGRVWDSKGEYDKALEFHQKCLDIRLKTLGVKHHYVSDSYFYIGLCYENLGRFQLGINAYLQGFHIERTGGYLFRIASCHEKLGDKQESLNYFMKSAIIRRDHPEVGLTDVSTIESIENAKRLAKELDQENELPEWIKTHSI
jgi:tetratricopeptide (TPR) repeat protein